MCDSYSPHFKAPRLHTAYETHMNFPERSTGVITSCLFKLVTCCGQVASALLLLGWSECTTRHSGAVRRNESRRARGRVSRQPRARNWQPQEQAQHRDRISRQPHTSPWNVGPTHSSPTLFAFFFQKALRDQDPSTAAPKHLARWEGGL